MIGVKLIEAFTGVVEAIVLCMLFESLLKRKENIHKNIYPVVYVALSLAINISFWTFGGNMLNLTCVFLLAFVTSFLYETNLKNRIAVPLIMIVFNMLSEMIVWYLICYLFNVTVTNGTENVELWILGAFSSKILIFMLANIIRLKLKNKKLFTNGHYWLLFVVVFVPMILTDHLLFTLTLSMSDKTTKFLAIASCIGLLVCAFIILYLYERIAEQAEIKNREEQYKQQIKSQTKHLDDILVMQNQIKGFRHDIKNHWVALRGYFQRNDYEGGIQYIDEMSEKLTSGETIDTGNVALDAIISTKKALAEEKNIEFESTVQIPEKMPIDATDICIIFGNTLDNAIEACEKIKDDIKHIKLSVIFEEDAILCKVSNTISKGIKLSMKTTKTDKENHGFGLENIKHALSKYNHVMKIDQTDKEFILSFIIFNK